MNFLITTPDAVGCAIALSSESYTAVEGDGVATVCLLLLGEPATDVSVLLETVPGSGTATGACKAYNPLTSIEICLHTFSLTADVDYVTLSETVILPPSSSGSETCHDVTLIDDSVEEEDETFQVQISQSVCMLSRTMAEVVIVDDGRTSIEYS